MPYLKKNAVTFHQLVLEDKTAISFVGVGVPGGWEVAWCGYIGMFTLQKSIKCSFNICGFTWMRKFTKKTFHPKTLSNLTMHFLISYN